MQRQVTVVGKAYTGKDKDGDLRSPLSAMANAAPTAQKGMAEKTMSG